MFRRAGTRRERLSLAGPVAFVTVIATWAGLLVLRVTARLLASYARRLSLRRGRRGRGFGLRARGENALPPDAADRLLAELTSRLVAVERDLVHFPISYYLSAGDPRFSLPVAASYLLEVARARDR